MIVEGVHYKRIKHKKWKYELLVDVEIRIDSDAGMWFQCENFDHEFFALEYKVRGVRGAGAYLKCKKGYAWDGFTCAPDLKNHLAASLFHDAALQAESLGLLLPRMIKPIHRLFNALLRRSGCPWLIRQVYYRAVLMFHGIYRRLS